MQMFEGGGGLYRSSAAPEVFFHPPNAKTVNSDLLWVSELHPCCTEGTTAL